MPTDLLQEVGMGEPHSRRRFFANISLALGGVMSALIAVPIIAYLLEPIVEGSPKVWEDLGAIDDFAVGTTKLVSFTDVGSVAWSGKTQVTGVYVRQNPKGVFVVWAENCTHLGCPLNWIPSAGIFECPCHGGVFYSNGEVAAGPPLHPMAKLPVRIRNGRVQAQSISLQVFG
ncbi:MAG: QcrA and Rieske domain-containing protein [Chloroflexota bacterium]